MIKLGHGGADHQHLEHLARPATPARATTRPPRPASPRWPSTWAKELARFGIRAASIAPGFIAHRHARRHAAGDAREGDGARAAQAPRPAGGDRARRRLHRRERLLHRARASTSTAACDSDRRSPRGDRTMQIQDTRAIVTGGASGLGLAVAEDVIAAGGKVALFDVNDQAGVDAVRSARRARELPQGRRHVGERRRRRRRRGGGGHGRAQPRRQLRRRRLAEAHGRQGRPDARRVLPQGHRDQPGRHAAASARRRRPRCRRTRRTPRANAAPS